jgi:hypothetical protein
MNDFIIPPINQDVYFTDSLFYQYLGTETGSRYIRAFIPGAYTDSANGIEYVYQSILDAFLIDEAVGAQLNLIGYLVGLPRMTLAAVGQAGFFGFDDYPNQAFDYGSFQDGRADDDALISDTTYRLLLKVKIAGNVWDGTRTGLKSILKIATSATKIDIINLDYDPTLNDPFYLDATGENQGFDSGEFDVALNPYAPFELDSLDDANGFDNGNFDVGTGYCQPGVFRIVFTGGVSSQDIDALLFLNLIPTPQGVRLVNVEVNIDTTYALEDGFGSVLTDGLGDAILATPV